MTDSGTDGISDEIQVLCRNLYLGADFALLLPAETALEPGEITDNFYSFVEKTDYAGRAARMAAEILTRKPHVVCLQEVYQYAINENISVEGGINFLAILMDHLRHLYREANVCAVTHAKLPLQRNGLTATLSVTDHSAILIRRDVELQQQESVVYRNTLQLPLPGGMVDVLRGFGCVTLRTARGAIKIANTHLESIRETVQLAQAEQLVDSFRDWRGPLLLVGDMNARPKSVVYDFFTASREERSFADAFADKQNTWGTGADLAEPHPDLKMRIDHIFHRGALQPLSSEVFGFKRQTDGGLWPSDHAGIMGSYRITAAAGN